MNSPEFVVTPKATRWRPGIKVPVAAPSWALDLTSAASGRSERPCAGGNCPSLGCSAAGSSSTAGGRGAALLVLEVDVGAALLAAAVDALGVELWLADEDPQPASASASASATSVATT